jgi:hypothetical protein
MPYLTAETHSRIIAQPSAMAEVWASSKTKFKNDVGSIFASKHDDILAAAFAAIAAYDLKPYGQSTAMDLRSLLDEPHLDCDNYCLLTWHLFTIIKPTSTVTLTMVGWDGGAVGNHAQIIAEIPAVSAWLLDPTIGLIVAGATFDNLCQGVPLTYHTQPAGTRDIAYSHKIKSAVSLGKYRPSDLLYYMTPERYITRSPREGWATPRA